MYVCLTQNIQYEKCKTNPSRSFIQSNASGVQTNCLNRLTRILPRSDVKICNMKVIVAMQLT